MTMTDEAPAPTRSIDELLPSFPLARCARIAASLDLDPDMTPDILRASKLAAEDWEVLDEHWQGAILAEIQAAKLDGRAAWDDHYLARIEEERGPISAEHYAGLVVAGERGSIDAKLGELGVPEDAILPIERVWLRRTSNDQALARAVKTAIAEARHA
jgi:hypothetical protein